MKQEIQHIKDLLVEGHLDLRLVLETVPVLVQCRRPLVMIMSMIGYCYATYNLVSPTA